MSSDLELVPQSIQDDLSYRQGRDLEAHYERYRKWLKEKGKDPDRNIGLSPTATRYLLFRTTQFHQWVWEQHGNYTTRIAHRHANQFEQALNEDTVQTDDGEPYAEGSKRKLQQAVVKYFLWRAQGSSEESWNPKFRFSQSDYNRVDYFTLDEREKLYEAVLTYDDLGKYNDLKPSERDRRKSYLAQKLGKPKQEVTPTDFEDCRRSWKLPSLVGVSLDIGARPIEIKRCCRDWCQLEKGVLRIPKQDAAKSNREWEVGLSSRSIQALNRWCSQRTTIPKYDDSEKLWLNREGNSYNSGSLNYLLANLIEEAGIDQTNRKISWYSIRRSTGTYLAYFQSLAYAKEQLRHKSLQSTLKYVEVPVEARREALDSLDGGFERGGYHSESPPSGATLEVLHGR